MRKISTFRPYANRWFLIAVIMVSATAITSAEVRHESKPRPVVIRYDSNQITLSLNTISYLLNHESVRKELGDGIGVQVTPDQDTKQPPGVLMLYMSFTSGEAIDDLDEVLNSTTKALRKLLNERLTRPQHERLHDRRVEAIQRLDELSDERKHLERQLRESQLKGSPEFWQKQLEELQVRQTELRMEQKLGKARHKLLQDNLREYRKQSELISEKRREIMAQIAEGTAMNSDIEKLKRLKERLVQLEQVFEADHPDQKTTMRQIQLLSEKLGAKAEKAGTSDLDRLDDLSRTLLQRKVELDNTKSAIDRELKSLDEQATKFSNEHETTGLAQTVAETEELILKTEFDKMQDRAAQAIKRPNLEYEISKLDREIKAVSEELQQVQAQRHQLEDVTVEIW